MIQFCGFYESIKKKLSSRQENRNNFGDVLFQMKGMIGKATDTMKAISNSKAFALVNKLSVRQLVYSVLTVGV